MRVASAELHSEKPKLARRSSLFGLVLNKIMLFFSSELWSVVTLSFACGRFTDAADEVFSDDADSDGA